MKQTEVFNKIGGIIKELSDQYEYLQTLNGELNDLELELFVSNAHFLADHIEILSKLNLQNSKSRPLPEQQSGFAKEKFFEPVVQQMHQGEPVPEEPVAPKEFKPAEMEITNNTQADDAPVPQIDLTTGSREDTYATMQEPPETIRHELILNEAENWEDDDHLIDESEISKSSRSVKPELNDEAAKNIPEQEAVIEPEPEPTVIHELPLTNTNSEEPAEKGNKPKDEEKVLTFNQKMADKTASRAEQTSIKPIGDIKLAITLNDKLLFVKDLFNGYNLAYSEAIEILNRFNTMDEAMRFLRTNYINKNNWEGKPATTEKFYALLRRRYA